MREAARQGVAADVDAVVGLARHARLEAQGSRGAAQWLWSDDAGDPTAAVTSTPFVDARGGVFVGTIDDVIVAYALASISTPAVGVRIAMIHELYVLPDARGVGVAEMLMDALLDWARSQACDAIESAVLPGNRAGKNLFERYGLTARLIVVHRDLRPHGLDQSEAPHVHE